MVTPMPAQDLSIVVRSGEAADREFIFNSWLKSFFGSRTPPQPGHPTGKRLGGGAFTRDIAGRVYFERHHQVIEDILGRADTRIVVAAPRETPFVICGWAVFEGPELVHYVYVKNEVRRLGVAKLLLESQRLPTAFRYSHHTMIVEGPRRRRPEAIYDPYAAFPPARVGGAR